MDQRINGDETLARRMQRGIGAMVLCGVPLPQRAVAIARLVRRAREHQPAAAADAVRAVRTRRKYRRARQSGQKNAPHEIMIIASQRNHRAMPASSSISVERPGGGRGLETGQESRL